MKDGDLSKFTFPFPPFSPSGWYIKRVYIRRFNTRMEILDDLLQPLVPLFLLFFFWYFVRSCPVYIPLLYPGFCKRVVLGKEIPINNKK